MKIERRTILRSLILAPLAAVVGWVKPKPAVRLTKVVWGRGITPNKYTVVTITHDDMLTDRTDEMLK